MGGTYSVELLALDVGSVIVSLKVAAIVLDIIAVGSKVVAVWFNVIWVLGKVSIVGKKGETRTDVVAKN